MTNEENKGAEFRVGDMVEWNEDDNRHSSLRHEGKLGSGKIFGSFGSDTWLVACSFGSRWGVTTNALRHEPAEQKARLYTTQPDVLPKKLPDGTLGLDGWAHFGVVLDHGTYLFRRAQCVADGRQIQSGGIMPDGLDWSKIPIQEDSPPARASADEPAAHGPECCCNACYLQWKERPKPGRADPYAMAMPKEHERYVAQQMVEQDAKRLSAMTLRERRKSEALRMMERGIPGPKHPVMWPEGSEYKGQV